MLTFKHHVIVLYTFLGYMKVSFFMKYKYDDNILEILFTNGSIQSSFNCFLYTFLGYMEVSFIHEIF